MVTRHQDLGDQSVTIALQRVPQRLLLGGLGRRIVARRKLRNLRRGIGDGGGRNISRRKQGTLAGRLDRFAGKTIKTR